MRQATLLFFILCPLLTGCFDLESPSVVNKFRVLGVSVEPPEIRPGDGTTIRVLLADPKGKGREISLAWMGCSGIVHASLGISTCDMLIPPVVTTATEGGDTLDIPVTPPDMLEGLPDGTSLKATIIVLMCAGGTLPAPDEYESLRDTKVINDLCKGGDGLSAFKTVTVSTSEDPQTNPVIDRLYFQGEELTTADEGGIAKVSCDNKECDAEVEIALFVTEESLQTFEVIEFGEPVQKEDTVFISWYVTGGDFTNSRSGDTCSKKGMIFDNPCLDDPDEDPTGPFETTWLPEKRGTFTLYAVAHDIRGGVSWKTYTVKATR